MEVTVSEPGQCRGQDLVGGGLSPGRGQGAPVQGQGGRTADQGIGKDPPARVESDEPCARKRRHEVPLIVPRRRGSPRPPLPVNFDDAFRAVSETCSASKQCGRRYPDLQRTLSQAVAALERSPVSVRVHGKNVVVDGVALVRVVRGLVSSHATEAFGQVPRIVYRALHGEVGADASKLAADSGMCIG